MPAAGLQRGRRPYFGLHARSHDTGAGLHAAAQRRRRAPDVCRADGRRGAHVRAAAAAARRPGALPPLLEGLRRRGLPRGRAAERRAAGGDRDATRPNLAPRGVRAAAPRPRSGRHLGRRPLLGCDRRGAPRRQHVALAAFLAARGDLSRGPRIAGAHRLRRARGHHAFLGLGGHAGRHGGSDRGRVRRRRLLRGRGRRRVRRG
mmetsp:Transcript_16681/g.48414  ORF Transcript_16681/g.48414 Transcript_16681/m.48414 type:complete len:204 (-) Transcript_16681:60-671(-)